MSAVPRFTYALPTSWPSSGKARSSTSISGVSFAMSGASGQHVRISVNVTALLVGQLKGRPCELYHSDMRVKVSPTGLYTNPRPRRRLRTGALRGQGAGGTCSTSPSTLSSPPRPTTGARSSRIVRPGDADRLPAHQPGPGSGRALHAAGERPVALLR